MALVIKNSFVIHSIKTEHDIIVKEKSDFYSPVETDGDIFADNSVTFHDSVKCRSFFSAVDESSILFAKDLICKDLYTIVPVVVDGNAFISEKIVADNVKLKFDNLILNGTSLGCVDEIWNKTKSSEEILFLENVPILKQESAIEPVVLCENCRLEKAVHSIFGQPMEIFLGSNQKVALCADCAHILKEDAFKKIERIPSDWELTHMSEEEKDFFATHGYVEFPPRFPNEPFIRIHQEAENGEVLYKEVYICDPEGKYLSPDDIENCKIKLTYNGGTYAWLLRGTISAGSFYTFLALTPAVGPVVAAIGWAASIPFSWKWSKKLTNLINDKFVLPYEVQARRDLIESRRKDEKIRQDIYIETL